MSDQVYLYDCTLRDGTQGEDVSLSVSDKLQIARRLNDFGVHFIEGGWPGSNPKDAEFFTLARQENWTSSLCAFGSTRHYRNKVQEDPNVEALIKAHTPVVTVVAKSWDFHVEKALRISLQENLTLIHETVEHLKKHVGLVVFDAEHFFDGYKDNPEYTQQVIDTAATAGADWIVLCDTNGGALPSQIANVTAQMVKKFDRIGIHTHNDCELGVANSVAAVESGASMVQGTTNGLGERTGNANLTSIIPIIDLKIKGKRAVGRKALRSLTSVSHFVAEVSNIAVNRNLPFVGRSAFAHKGGIHVNALQKDPRTYEHMTPQEVGNQRRILISDLAGRASLNLKLKEFGIDPKNVDLDTLLVRIKKLEYEGYQFEGAEGSLRLLITETVGDRNEPFSCSGFQVSINNLSGQFLSEASVKVRVDGQEENAIANGNGPVHALDRAVKKAVARFFSEAECIRLIDYKVRVLDAHDGTGAQVRVLIESTDGEQTWSTVGVSHNVIEASWTAIIDSIRYKLLFLAS